MRGELHVAEHITVFDLVGIAQMVVHDPELFVAFVKPPVDFVNQGGVAPQPPVLALRVEQQQGYDHQQKQENADHDRQDAAAGVDAVNHA